MSVLNQHSSGYLDSRGSSRDLEEHTAPQEEQVFDPLLIPALHLGQTEWPILK